MRYTLTKDDFYEIEKICDIYTGWINNNIRQCCDKATHYDVIKKDKTPMDVTIMKLTDA